MKDVVKKKVDAIVVAIDGGKKPEDFAAAANEDPICVRNGSQRQTAGASHPGRTKPQRKSGSSLSMKLPRGLRHGAYVKYEWGGAKKCTYSRKTKSGLIVGCWV